jgi:hypothetical protein
MTDVFEKLRELLGCEITNLNRGAVKVVRLKVCEAGRTRD